LGHPVALAIEAERLYGSAAPAAKNEQAAGERVGSQFLAAKLGQSINTFPLLRCTAKEEICAVHRYAEFCESGARDFQIFFTVGGLTGTSNAT
jgi:hypothetical protein